MRLRLIVLVAFVSVHLAVLKANDISEMNEVLEHVKQVLEKDPRNEKEFSKIIDLINGSNVVARANAVATIGDLASNLSPELTKIAISTLIRILEEDDMFAKREAVLSIKKFGTNAKEAIPVLIKNLQAGESDVAWNAAEALGAFGPDASTAGIALIEAIKGSTGETYFDDRASLKKFAIIAFGDIFSNSKSIHPHLVLLLRDRNPYIRMHAAIAVLQIDTENLEGRAQIQELLENQDVRIRRNVLWSLLEREQKGVFWEDLYSRMRGDPDKEVRVAAEELIRGNAGQGAKTDHPPAR